MAAVFEQNLDPRSERDSATNRGPRRSPERSDRQDREDREKPASAASSSAPRRSPERSEDGYVNGSDRPAAFDEEARFLSLNPRISPLPQECTPPQAKVTDMKKTDPQLADEWTVWEHSCKDKADYKEGTKQLVNFNTVKSFWGCWNQIPQPSTLLEGKRFARVGSNGNRTVVDSLMIFKKGVAPEWEDPANKNGGHFMLQLKPQLGGLLIDELWNNIVLGMIGGYIEPADMVTGVRMVDKLPGKGKLSVIRIELWFNEPTTSEKIYDLRGSFERCLAMGLDGKAKVCKWGYTETVSHCQDGDAPPARPARGGAGQRR